MAIYKTFDVALELKQTSTNPTFSVIEGDTGNRIHITVTDGGSAVDLSGCRVIAVFSKTNGISMQDSGVEGGGVEIGGSYQNEITISLFASSFAPGNIECELQIYSGEDMATLITTAYFNFACRRAKMNEDVLLGTNEYPLLVDLITTVEGFVDVEAARVLAEQGRVAAEVIREDNEDIRNQNELERVSYEARRDEAEAVRVSNENARILNENSRKGAENNRVIAEGERVTAENNRATAETARDTAEKNRATAETGRANAETLRASAEEQRVLEFAKWLAANAVANTLPAGSEATAELVEVNGAKRFILGIPKGADGEGTGDMSKSTYDTNGNGIVDNAEKLGGKLPSEYQEAIKTATATLPLTDWTGAQAPYTQVVNVNDVTADDVLIVGGDDGYSSAGVKCTAQAAGKLTFSCESVPEADVTASIVIVRR